MATILNPDICVIGGGAAGLSVAAGAAAFGVPVVLIEHGKMGGDCLNYGCVPSKTLIAAAKRAEVIRKAAPFGLVAGGPVAEAERLRERIREVIDGIAPQDSIERFDSLGVQVITETARFVDKRTVAAGNHLIRARRFVIATGSSPVIPSIAGLAETPFLTNETLFELDHVPDHLLVIGAGPVGLELAQAYRRLGARVTVIDGAEALSREDPELKAIVLGGVCGEGIVLHQRTTVRSVERTDGGVRLHCENANGRFHVDGSDMLLAAGRAANHRSLDLAAAGIRYGTDRIEIADNLRTSNRRVFAIGDAAGGLQFTHVASYHARLVLQQILFRLPARDIREIIPRVTFTDPEIAQVGLTEREARERSATVHILRSDFAANDRARTDHLGPGMVKLVIGRRGRILGAGIVGAGAGELINNWAFAIANHLTLKSFLRYVAPYPTLSEIGKQAAISYYSPVARNRVVRTAIRILRCFG